MLLLDPQEKVH